MSAVASGDSLKGPRYDQQKVLIIFHKDALCAIYKVKDEIKYFSLASNQASQSESIIWPTHIAF